MSAAGLYKHLIHVIKINYAPDSYGSMVRSDDTVVKTRARIMHTGGSKGVEEGETWTQYSKQFMVHRYIKIDDFDEVEWNGNRYKITSIEDVPEYNHKLINTELINT